MSDNLKDKCYWKFKNLQFLMNTYYDECEITKNILDTVKCDVLNDKFKIPRTNFINNINKKDINILNNYYKHGIFINDDKPKIKSSYIEYRCYLFHHISKTSYDFTNQ